MRFECRPCFGEPMKSAYTDFSFDLIESFFHWNVLVIGRSGSGKTEFLKAILAEMEYRGMPAKYLEGCAADQEQDRRLILQETQPNWMHFLLDDLGSGGNILRHYHDLHSVNPTIRIIGSLQSFEQLSDLDEHDVARLKGLFGCTILLDAANLLNLESKRHPIFNFIRSPRNVLALQGTHSYQNFEGLSLFEHGGELAGEPLRITFLAGSSEEIKNGIH